MKRTILALLMSLLISFVTFAQTDTTSTFVVRDTTLQSDARLNFLTSTILPAIAKNFNEEVARQKVNGEATHLEATEAVFTEIQAAVQKYAMNFIVVNEVQVDTTQLVTEFNKLNEKIAELQNDPDIKYIEAVAEFKNIQERQAKLAKYYEQIQKEIASLPEYATFKQPLGAHDAYKKGDKVLFEGKLYESTIDANVWAPNVTGWKEVTK